MDMTRKAFVGAALSAVASTAAAQSSDAAVPNGTILRPYNNAWHYSVRQPDGATRALGIWSDLMQEHVVNGDRALMRVQGLTRVNGDNSSTVNIFDPVTMLPISSETRGTNGSTRRRTFGAATVRTVTIAALGADEAANEFSVEPPVYDYYGGMWGLLLATFPLHSGAQGSFRSVEESEDAVAPVTYEVVGRERVSAGAHGRVRAWRVAANRPGAFNLSFWLTEAPPYVLKLELRAEGTENVRNWDMF